MVGRTPVRGLCLESVADGLGSMLWKPSHLACRHKASGQSTLDHQPCNAILLVAAEAFWPELLRPRTVGKRGGRCKSGEPVTM